MHLTRSTQVNAPAERVWSLVSDLPAMGRLSPENVGGEWRKGASGPAVGARFRGHNRKGWRRWSTDVLVTRCEPGQSFAIAVSSFGIPVAEWAYEIAPHEDGGCTVAESWADRRPGWFKGPASLVTGGGYADTADVAANLDSTLEALRQLAERADTDN
jgi:ligand-binding SRPBCC domain-containing protein